MAMLMMVVMKMMMMMMILFELPHQSGGDLMEEQMAFLFSRVVYDLV